MTLVCRVIVTSQLPPAHEPGEVLPVTEVAIAGDPERAEAVLSIGIEFGRLRLDVPIPADHDEPKPSDNGHPVWVLRPRRNRRQSTMAREHDVTTHGRQRSSDPHRCLVDVDAELLIARHLCSLRLARPSQLVADRLLDLPLGE